MIKVFSWQLSKVTTDAAVIIDELRKRLKRFLGNEAPKT
jgi:hypothetical protein